MPLTPSELDATTVTPQDGLPGYEFLDVIGCGGVGTVYRARQLKLDRFVAIKVIRPDRAASASLTSRFAAEAVILGKLRHPNVVQLLDFSRHGERTFLVLELLDGEDLGRHLQRTGACDERLAWAVALQAASALAHAAAHGVVHRDVKPSNLFLVPSSTGFPSDIPLVKVMDFGLAKWTADVTDEQLTAPGVLLGTPAYMAPEQYRQAGTLDHRADIYSLGATAFHALAGRPPFSGATVWDVMEQKLSHAPRLPAHVSRESADLVAQMMHSDPNERIVSYDELIERIRALRVVRRFVPAYGFRQPTAGQGRGRRPWAAIAGVVIAIGFGAWAARGLRPTDSMVGATGEPAADSPRHLEPTGEHVALFDGATLNGWLTLGGGWRVETDEEGVKVVQGSGTMRRSFDPAADYRFTIGLDVHKASAAEVQFGIAAGEGNRASRHVLRVSRDGGAVFGTRAGDAGDFKQTGSPIPFPSAVWFEERRPYLEVKFERAGGRWTAWFNGREACRLDDTGHKAAELRLVAEGGPARVDSVLFTTLRAK